MLRLWRLSRSDGITSMSQTHTLRAHSGPVLCITACKTWSIIVSGSEDGSAVIWDLNRAIYVRSIWHGDTIEHDSVNLVAVNDSTVCVFARLTHDMDLINYYTGIHCELLSQKTVPPYSKCDPDC